MTYTRYKLLCEAQNTSKTYGFLVSPPQAGKFLSYFPPIFRDPGGEKRVFAPPYFETQGGEITFISPPNGGENPAAGGKFSGFDLLKYSISFTKMYFDTSNPENFPPAAGYFHA